MLLEKFRLSTRVASLLIAAFLTLSGYVQAGSARWDIGLELGNVRQSYNNVQIPGTGFNSLSQNS